MNTDKTIELKNVLCDRHLLPIEDMMRLLWPDEDPKITLLIRTPWLSDGGILITNDSPEKAIAELERLRLKEAVR